MHGSSRPPKLVGMQGITAYLLAFLVVAYGALFFTGFWLQHPVTLVQYFHFGNDHIDFLNASRDVLAGANPYERPRFVTPPPSALLNLPLVHLRDGAAARVFFLANIVAVFASVTLLVRACRLQRLTAVCAVLLPFLSAQTLMLIERGNIDGLLAVLVAAAIVLIEHEWFYGALLGLAASLKIYPAVMLALPLARGRWRAIGGAAVVVAAFAATMPHLFILYAHNLSHRALTAFQVSENLSLYALETPLVAGRGSKLVYLALLTAAAAFGMYRDRRGRAEGPTRRALTASYLVFAVNFPQLVFLYTGIVVLLMAVVMSDVRLRFRRQSAWLFGIGSALVMLPARSFGLTVSGGMWPHKMDYLPPFGSLLLLAFFVTIRLDGQLTTEAALPEGQGEPGLLGQA